MDATALLTVVLRVLHIVFGMVWVGGAVLTAWVLHPTARQMGENGLAMLRTFYAHSRINQVLPLAMLVTTVAGLILWPLQTTRGIDFATLPATGDGVMAIGAVAGLLAFGHSFFATRAMTGKFAAAAREYATSPAETGQTTLAPITDRLYLHSNISAGLSLIAIVCMSGARYLG